MKIFVLIPVFNRIAHTRAVLFALREQTIADLLKIIIIDDGSDDGTHEFLKGQSGIDVIQGDGNLWWAGAIQAGLDHSKTLWSVGDFVLFLNNDLIFEENYIETLLSEMERFPNAAIGSALFDRDCRDRLLKLGPKINLAKREIYDLSFKLGCGQNFLQNYDVDALGGRGTLYRVEFFEKFGMLRPTLLPHYFADYEISSRFKRHGIDLIVSTISRVYSQPVYGYQESDLSFFAKFFTNKSQRNLFHGMVFYFLISSGGNKVVMPILSLYWGLKDACLHLMGRHTRDN